MTEHAHDQQAESEPHAHFEHEPPTTPVEVVMEALAAHAHDTDLEARAVFIVTALQEYGWLPDEDSQAFDPEAAAKWLADRSGFARYLDPDKPEAWRKILQSEMDVDVAATKAAKRVSPQEAEMLRVVHAGLLAWHQHRKAHVDD